MISTGIQYSGSPDTAWTPRPPAIYASPVSDPTISDDELRDAAQAARLAAAQTEGDAARQTNPRITATFEMGVARYKALAVKFERARGRRARHRRHEPLDSPAGTLLIFSAARQTHPSPGASLVRPASLD
jgi:hypothetical protein